METIYYNLDARRVSTCDMASGETTPQCHSYAVLRKVEQKRADQGGKVLDLAAYRRKLEFERDAEETFDAEALPGATAPAYTAVPAATQAVSHRARRTRLLGLSLDAFATACILVMAIAVVAAFLPFL